MECMLFSNHIGFHIVIFISETYIFFYQLWQYQKPEAKAEATFLEKVILLNAFR